MLAVEFVRWWYGAGWLRMVRAVRDRIRRIALSFSVPLLLRTLFAPWRRIISYGGDSIADKAKAALDNVVSRAVGFCVRLIVIVVAGISIVFTAVGGGLLIVVWPLAPVLGLILIVRGVMPW
jgi:hypothetical protein